jgi:hypothetical protein
VQQAEQVQQAEPIESQDILDEAPLIKPIIPSKIEQTTTNSESPLAQQSATNTVNNPAQTEQSIQAKPSEEASINDDITD